jgi:hypothetical protein
MVEKVKKSAKHRDVQKEQVKLNEIEQKKIEAKKKKKKNLDLLMDPEEV